jgi:hypothetical protein
MVLSCRFVLDIHFKVGMLSECAAVFSCALCTSVHPKKTQVPVMAGLQRWHAAVSRLPRACFLPLGFGGTKTADVDAFHGDKLLSSAVSNALYQDSIERTVGQLTTLLSNAVSNAHLAQQLPDLLPQLDLSAAGFAMQTHTAGTAVEAALWHVHRAGDCEAVEEVATWLLRSAASDESPHNPKGQLLEIGGIVEARCVRGEGTHDPMFRAQGCGRVFDTSGTPRRWRDWATAMT